MNNPKVSVIINCFNGSGFVNNCLKSVIKQSYSNYEIILFDNNSSDDSIKQAKKFNSKKIKIFKSKKKLKLYDARNKAIDKSKGKYLAFLDIDDTWYPKKIEKQINKINLDNSDICYTNHWLINGGKKIFSKNKLPSKNMTFEILDNYPICISTVLMKRNIFFKMKKFDNKYEIIGDFDFIYRASKKYKFSAIQEPLAEYLIHQKSTTNKRLDLRVSEMNKWLYKNKNNKFFNQFQKINLKNQYFASSYFIINKKYKKFFQSLISIKNINLKLKLLIKMSYYLIFK
jgi:glycosyltransferase involved in cell wall biosynthesis|tara:strand:+ start:54 stop:911 length:858 start_codon:yes stop_codon:yes gene_type:complete